MKKMTERIGERNMANNGLIMTIIAYRGESDIDIEFEDGTIVTNKKYSNYANGQIEHPTLKCVRGPKPKISW